MSIPFLRKTCLFSCTFILFGVYSFCPQHAYSDEIVPITVPAISKPSMPIVQFNHSKHVAYVESHDSDCSRCHRLTKEGLSTAVLDVRLQKKQNQVSYLHMACTTCHKASGQGPALSECRSCHRQQPALKAEK